MRMWMTEPRRMCRKHLLGEHVEIHMTLGAIEHGKSIAGYVAQKLLQPISLYHRHQELVWEMRRRGYNHKSDLTFERCMNAIRSLPKAYRNARVDQQKSRRELHERCFLCFLAECLETGEIERREGAYLMPIEIGLHERMVELMDSTWKKGKRLVIP